MTPREPSFRLVRAAVFATACVSVSVGGHTFAGGGSVPLAVIGLGAIGALVMAYALNGRERGAEVVLTATIGAQIVLHQLFSWSAPKMITYAEHDHPFGMLLVHLAVAALTGWWLYRGERAVWLMLRLWARASLSALRWVFLVFCQPPPPVRRPVQTAEPETFAGREIATVVSRRGPPLAVLAG
ncbi:hypothetical protein Acor_54370 [Acrocarpospora corrugata]|uniref:Uncharacterized protein n=1 Tax=Acrocarpospora corrugata TaxID=35763 RepID=A0A5M3W8E8_9ACTN|nr:hypothetical protein [Acrocarpospora corrugata]GES03371.1 hypothetical protein Acor_54370 [Acrocarpospora corrugata]